ncbi:hypothetical protein FQN60_006692 [Etheostoma spectabile]|uniref:Uncharacterized protein n=1 Tax=Etheostoma spectabile TaxID=54343 RepID=A0A5J5CGP0_9PERO|nr:hypothetical protein FQN60_006692 [Etheostoma spectabile]
MESPKLLQLTLQLALSSLLDSREFITLGEEFSMLQHRVGNTILEAGEHQKPLKGGEEKQSAKPLDRITVSPGLGKQREERSEMFCRGMRSCEQLQAADLVLWPSTPQQCLHNPNDENAGLAPAADIATRRISTGDNELDPAPPLQTNVAGLSLSMSDSLLLNVIANRCCFEKPPPTDLITPIEISMKTICQTKTTVDVGLSCESTDEQLARKHLVHQMYLQRKTESDIMLYLAMHMWCLVWKEERRGGDRKKKGQHTTDSLVATNRQLQPSLRTAHRLKPYLEAAIFKGNQWWQKGVGEVLKQDKMFCPAAMIEAASLALQGKSAVVLDQSSPSQRPPVRNKPLFHPDGGGHGVENYRKRREACVLFDRHNQTANVSSLPENATSPVIEFWDISPLFEDIADVSLLFSLSLCRPDHIPACCVHSRWCT